MQTESRPTDQPTHVHGIWPQCGMEGTDGACTLLPQPRPGLALHRPDVLPVQPRTCAACAATALSCGAMGGS